MDEADLTQAALFYRFGTAVAIGLLVGLQREFTQTRRESDAREASAGARTFALLSLLGCTAAFVSDRVGSPLPMTAVFLVFGALIIVSYHFAARVGRLGLTSEVAAIITLLAGSLCYWGELVFAAALAVTTTVVLALKLQTRAFATRLTSEDVRSTLTFAVLTLVILPVLPHYTIAPAPFDVLVPYKIWLMVVFISGISFLGYIMIKIVGPRRGVALTGLTGGLASSTAVTLSFAQRSRGLDRLARPFALAILLAWTIMFVRVLLEVAVVNGPLLNDVWLPMCAATVVSLTYCVVLYSSEREEREEDEDNFTNPFELGPALTFGLAYVVILLVTNLARIYFGDKGIYVSSIVSGLADVDAITLSMAELSRDPATLDRGVAARAIVLAAASNTVVKAGIVLATGSAALRSLILPGLALTLGTAVGVVFLL